MLIAQMDETLRLLDFAALWAIWTMVVAVIVLVVITAIVYWRKGDD